MYTNQEIIFAKVTDAEHGTKVAGEVLKEFVNERSLLLLSGGSTPRKLYRHIANEEVLKPGAVGMVDERYGGKLHPDSNELMMQESGILRYLTMRDIPFHPILDGTRSREETAYSYDQLLRESFSQYQSVFGILGIGTDGHTAGIPTLDESFRASHQELYSGTDIVSSYHDENGSYGERITMTFLGLSHLDRLLVLVFGDDKKAALENVLSEGSESEIPGRFLKRPEIAGKTLIITDQML